LATIRQFSPKAIQWVNQTVDPVSIWIPNGERYPNRHEDSDTGEVHEFITPFHVAAKGELHLAVKENPFRGRYPYEVYCEVIKGFAKGNSAPEVDCP
jgi:hypothetical protein